VNVKNLKLYEPTLVVEDVGIMLPSNDDLAPKHMSIFIEDVVFENKKYHLAVVNIRCGVSE